MFYVSLLPALIIAVGAYRAARPYPEPIRWVGFIVCGAVAVIAPVFIVFIISPVVAYAFAALAVALGVWWLVRQRLRTFFPLLLIAVAIPYGLLARDALKEHAARKPFLDKYPLGSLAERVPEPRADHRHAPLTADALLALNRIEAQADCEASPGQLRKYILQELHERSVHVFVNNPGFGVGRTIRTPPITERGLNHGIERDPTPAQPGSPVQWGGEPFTPLVERTELVTLHTDGVLDFVNPRGWGYVQSRDRVAGFLPHRFSKVPAARTFAVQRVELVGLLKHTEPVVYLSDRLPAMADLRDVPTRPLDAFETAALDRVRQGDDGFAASRGEVVRFVGGIRSAKQCVQCHGGERGDLLGAFAYTLRANP